MSYIFEMYSLAGISVVFKKTFLVSARNFEIQLNKKTSFT